MASLSVLITYYNEKELLTQCLYSLMAGGARPTEILIYDDASPAPARNYVPHGLKVRVLEGKQNRGPSFARNMLLNEAIGDFVHFQDADDLFHPDWLLKVGAAIDETNPDIVLTEIETFRGDKKLSPKVLELAKLKANPDLVAFCLRGSLITNGGTYRRTLVQSIGGYSEKLVQSEDFYFHVKLAATGATYAVIDEALIRNRVRNESRSQKLLEVWESTLSALHLLIKELPQKYRPELSEAAARVGSTLFYLGNKKAAAEAFALSKECGKAKFEHKSPLFRLLLPLMSPLRAEGLASVYRKLKRV